MDILEQTFNSCDVAAAPLHTIAFYSHLLPIALTIILALYLLVRTNYSLISRAFALFVIPFVIWLGGDLLTWVYGDYYLITYFWSMLDYINALFFVFAGIFYLVLIRKRDIGKWEALGFAAVVLPTFLYSVTGQSIYDMNQAVCEVIENEMVTYFKFFAEAYVMVYITAFSIYYYRKADSVVRRQILVVGSALMLFLLVFSVTEYLASQYDIYEINLYGLFVLPIFLAVIIFSITSLKIFEYKTIGAQILVYMLIIMIGSQLLFLEDTSDKILSGITLVLSIMFSFILVRIIRREAESKAKIEKLVGELEISNSKLVEMDHQKSEFISFASHQLRAPITAMKGYTSMMLEGDYGEVNSGIREILARVYDSCKTLASVVDDYLNISRIELGTMKYNFAPVNLRYLVDSAINDIRPNIDKSGLKFEYTVIPIEATNFIVKLDEDKFKQVVTNLLDNAVKYSKGGSITVNLTRNNTGNKIILSIKDTGIGIPPEIIPRLFSKFVRATNANKVNSRGTGLGLYVAKEIVTAHGGKISVTSDGEGRGSTFTVELKSYNAG